MVFKPLSQYRTTSTVLVRSLNVVSLPSGQDLCGGSSLAMRQDP